MARMQMELDKENDRTLSPFVFERDDEYDMCEVSMEQKDGWKAISILIDSGARDSVAPPGLFPQIKVLETPKQHRKMLLETARCNNHCRRILRRQDKEP